MTTLQPDAAQFALDLEQAEADQLAQVLCEQALQERLARERLQRLAKSVPAQKQELIFEI